MSVIKTGRIYDDWTDEDFQRWNRLNMKRRIISASMVRKGDRLDRLVMKEFAVDRTIDRDAFSRNRMRAFCGLKDEEIV